VAAPANRFDGEKHMSMTIYTSRLGHAPLKDHLTEEELNAVVGGTWNYTIVKGAYYGAINAVTPGAWIHPMQPVGVRY
jgi:hypothetical protein